MDSNHWPSGYEPDELPSCSTPLSLLLYIIHYLFWKKHSFSFQIWINFFHPVKKEKPVEKKKERKKEFEKGVKFLCYSSKVTDKEIILNKKIEIKY